MKILVAFESSGTVRDAFRARGWDAVSCDLLPGEGSGPHIQGDVRDVLRDGCWGMVIAHPPCRYLTSSGMHWTRRGLRDPQLTEDALEMVRFVFNHPAKYLCVENSVGVISSRIRKPDQIVQPYRFGSDASKATCLWLRGLPKLVPTEYVEPRWVQRFGKSPLPRWSNQTDSGQNRLGPSEDRWRLRSRTYPGIAAAMAAQWTEHLIWRGVNP